MTDSEAENDEDRWLEARERGEPLPAIPQATAARYAQLQSLLDDLPTVPAGARLLPGWQQTLLDAIDRGDAEPAPADGTLQARPIETAQPTDTALLTDTAQPTDTAPPADTAPLLAKARSIDAVHAIEAARAQRLRRNQRIAIAASGVAAAAGIVIVLTISRPMPTTGPVAELTISPVATGEPMLAGAEQLRAGSKAVARGTIDGPGELRVYGADDRELARCTRTGPGCTVTRSDGRTELRVELLLPVPGPLHILLLSAPLEGASTGRADDLEAAERAGIRTKPLDAKVW